MPSEPVEIVKIAAPALIQFVVVVLLLGMIAVYAALASGA